MYKISDLTRHIDSFIFNSYTISAQALGAYRICYSLYLLLFGIPIFQWISFIPKVFFNPPPLSFPFLLPGMPGYYFFTLISLGVCVFTVLLLFGYKTRSVSVILALLIFTGKSFAYSFGKIDHDFLIWMVPLVMAFSNWGAAYSLDAYRKKEAVQVNSWPVALLALILGLAMFSAGLPKLFGGWLDVSSQATQGHFFREFFVNERQDLLAPLFMQVDSAFFWEIFDYTAVIWELLFLVVVFKPNLFRSFIVVAIIFHVMNYLLLNIVFTHNLMLYLLFADWNWILKNLKKLQGKISIRKIINFPSLIILLTVYTSIFIFYMVFNNDISFVFSPLTFLLEEIFNIGQMIIGGFILFVSLLLAIMNSVVYLKKKKFSPSGVKYMADA